MEAGNPFDKVKGQIALGGEAFLEQLAQLLEGKAEIDENPLEQLLAGRPILAELFGGGQSRKERNAGIVEAVKRWGYSQKEVADWLGLHYSSVSRIVGKGLTDPCS